MNRSRGVLVTAAAFAVLTAGAGEGAAQQRRGMGRPADRAQLEERVRARFADMIRERLGLTDQESRLLAQTMDSFAGERQRLFQEEQALRRRTEAVLVDPDATAEEAAAVLSRMTALRMEEARLFEAEQEALLEVLSPLQLVRFHAMREQLSQRIRQLRGGAPPMGPPGRPLGRDHGEG